MSEANTEGSVHLPLQESMGAYYKPFPEETVVSGEEMDSPAHEGDLWGGIDYLVPLGTPVLAPWRGVVIKVVDDNDQFGPTEEYKGYLNYITIEHHDSGEYSQVAHLAKGSARVRVGDMVSGRQEIAATGISGWMTVPHLHFFVFKNTYDGKIKGLKPSFLSFE